MKKVLLILGIFISNAYGQTFLQDIGKIQHAIAENEVDSYLQNPTSAGPLSDTYLNALMPIEMFNPATGCFESTDHYKPFDLKYRVLLVTEEDISDEQNESQKAKTTVVLEQLKFEEEDGKVAKTIKDFVHTQGETPGKFSVSESKSKGKQIITYAANGLSLDLNTNLRSTNSINLDINQDNLVQGTLSVDFVNRLNFAQTISSGTKIQGHVESFKSTGTQKFTELEGDVEINNVNAELKLDSKLDDNVSAYTGVMYRDDNFTKEVKTVAGMNLNLPSNKNIIIFTGITATTTPGLTSRNREYSIEFKTSKDFKLYGRVRNDSVQGRYYEAGLSVDLKR